jgi:thiamine biosynthesis lipoprotein
MAVAEHRFRVMASDGHIIATDPPSGALVEARQRLEQLEQRWSRFLPGSDISRINAADGRPIGVHADTVTLVATMVEAWRLTAGRCDASVLPALLASGYGEHRVSLSRPDGSRPLAHVGRLDAIVIDPHSSTVTAPPGMALDPGGVGKGLAADVVVRDLLAAGARGALVDVGGDLACAGAPPSGAGWSVVVEHPACAGADLAAFAVSGGGVATSSTRTRRWIHDGVERHHIIDPSTGACASTDLAAVTVIAPCGWQAEAHATAAILCGSSAAPEYLHAHDLSGIIVTADGRIFTSADLTAMLVRGRGGGP